MLYDPTVRLIRAIYNRRISDAPTLDPRVHFPGSAEFSGAWMALREEGLRVASTLAAVPRFHELMSQQESISADDGRDWRMLVVKAYGVSFRENMARCPVLARLLARDPAVTSATFSFLAPHKHIPMHCGPMRGVVRYYLGLSVPLAPDGLPGTTLVLDGVEHRIGDGEALLWDDTYPHAVRNNTDQLRVALLLDVRRRGMPLDMELMTRLIFGSVGTAVRLRRWAAAWSPEPLSRIDLHRTPRLRAESFNAAAKHAPARE